MKKKNDSKTRRALTRILKIQGPQTAKKLAEDLAISAMAVRQHLYALADEKLITFREEKQVMGRPIKLWSLTKEADQFFPDAHAELSVGLLDSVKSAFGADGLEKVFALRIAQQLESYREQLKICQSLEEKVSLLSQLRTAEGYMAEYIVQENDFFLIENHCPICVAATACQGLCGLELKMFQDCLQEEAIVERTEHIISGQRRCAYKISTKLKG